MRFASRAFNPGGRSNVFQMPSHRTEQRDEPELTAVRGLLIAATLSAVFWGACLTLIWLMRSRS